MSETWPIGLDNLEGPFHLPGKFGGLFLLCQPASLSSPHALSWGSFRKSCHDYSADKRICAVLPSPAGGGGGSWSWGVWMGIACALISEAVLGHSWGSRSCRLHSPTGPHAQHKPQGLPEGGVPGSTEAVGDAGEGKAIPGASCPRAWGLGTARLGRLWGLKDPLSPAYPLPTSLCCCLSALGDWAATLGGLRVHRELIHRTQHQGQAGGTEVLPVSSPVPCPQQEGRPGLQEGAGPG